jgi:cobalt-zinc-cadmium efflux system protein
MNNTNQDSDANHQEHDHEAHTHGDKDLYLIPFLLIFTFAIIEAVGSWYTGSLALLSDAGHMFSDVAALGLAWIAGILSKKPNIAKHSSGVTYVELGVSIFNAISLLIVIVFVVVEAIVRFKTPYQVRGFALTVIATLGLIVNIVVAKQLHLQANGHSETLNNRAAFLHVVGDLLGSVTAVTAGVVIFFTGWMLIDPILSLLISIILLAFTLKLISDIWETIHLKSSKSRLNLGQHDH